LADSGRIPASYAEDLPAGGIIAFLHSDLAKRMADAEARGELFREQPFVLGVEASLLRPEFPSEETVLVQGIIDAYFIENGELVLVDYKTDRVSDPQALIDRYQVQLDLYERALTQIIGMNVREKLIYAIALKRVITL
jgi:ATP-dependent helicase/nuclease subunit A